MLYNEPMANIFEMNSTSLKSFIKFYKKAPKRAQRVTARLLSQFAFGVREQAMVEITKSMTIRSAGLIKSKIRWQGAKATDIDSQFSRTFSVGGRGFTGWAEQETGAIRQRSRSQTLSARRNNFKNKVKPSFRMKSSNNFLTESDFSLPKGRSRMPAYLQKIRRKHKKRPFIIEKKWKRFRKGLYLHRRGKLVKLQSFDARPTRVKRNKWMSRARTNYFKSINLEKEWIKAIDNVLTRKRF